LGRRAQVTDRQRRNHDIAEKGVGSLQALIGSPPTDEARYAEQRAYQVCGDQQQNGQEQRDAPEARSGVWTFSRAIHATITVKGVVGRQPGAASVGQLHQPGGDHDERDGADEADLVRLEDAAGKDVEEKRGCHYRCQPTGFEDGG